MTLHEIQGGLLLLPLHLPSDLLPLFDFTIEFSTIKKGMDDLFYPLTLNSLPNVLPLNVTPRSIAR